MNTVDGIREAVLRQRGRIWVKGPRSVAYARIWAWQMPWAIRRGWWPAGIGGTLFRRIVARWPHAVDEYPN